MGLRTQGRGRTRGRRSARRGRSSGTTRGRRTAASGLQKRVARLEATKEETKHIIYSDNAVSGAAVTPWLNNFNLNNASTGGHAGVLLNPTVKGDAVKHRTGDKAVFTKINIAIRAKFGSLVADRTWIRWAIVCVKDNRGADWHRPEATGGFFMRKFGVTIPTENSLPNINNFSQGVTFNILKQGKFVVAAPTLSSAEEHVIHCRWYSKGKQTDYSLGDLGTFADIDKNAIYFYMWTNNGILSSGVTLNGEAQVFFHG